MRENRSTFEILGPLVGLAILIAVLYAAVGYFRQGTTEFNEEARVIGRPVTLTESLSGEPLTNTTDLTGTTALTGAMGITSATNLTATDGITAASGATTTAPLEAATITATTDLTATTPVTATTDVTITQTATVTTDVTATTTITEDTPLAETPVTTTTSVVTATNVLTTGDQLTDTSGLTTTGTTTGTTATNVEEAAPEFAAIFTKGGCIGCHVIPGVPTAMGQVGPNLTTIGVTAATRIDGYSSEEYLRESLLNPNDFIVPECPTGPCLPNLMVQNLGDLLTPQELDTVVAYLASLGTTE